MKSGALIEQAWTALMLGAGADEYAPELATDLPNSLPPIDPRGSVPGPKTPGLFARLAGHLSGTSRRPAL